MGFLNLKGVVGLGKDKSAKIENRWDTFEEARKELEKHGFKIGAPPKGAIPETSAALLDNIQGREYTSHYSKLVAWLSWGESLRGSYESEHIGVRNGLKALSAEIKKAAKDNHEKTKGTKGWKALTPAELTEHVLIDPQHQEFTIRSQIIEQKLELLSGFLRGHSRTVALMSRNIELKRIEIENQGRGGRPIQSGSRNPSYRSRDDEPPTLEPVRRRSMDDDEEEEEPE